MAALRPLIESKVMRTMVAVMRQTAPRVMVTDRVWMIVGPNITSLTYDPKTRLVRTRANPTELWTALGISPPPRGATVTLDGAIAP
jgi:hypothetical protein